MGDNWVFPSRWQSYFPPVAIDVECQEGVSHEVIWVNGTVTTPRHTQKETIFSALGGDICECLKVAEIWRRGSLPEGISPSSVVSALPVSQVECFFARLSKNDATKRIFADVMSAWMQVFGADRNRPADVMTFGSCDPAEISHLSSETVGGFGAWGNKMPSRGVAFLSHDWYEQGTIRTPVQNSMLFVGSNGQNNIFLSPAEHKEHKGIIVAEPKAFKNRDEVFSDVPLNRKTICGQALAVTSDELSEYQGMIAFDTNPGKKQGVPSHSFPTTFLHGQKDALGWMMTENVWRTFMLQEYVDVADENLQDLRLLFKQTNLDFADVAELANLCACHNISLDHVSNSMTEIRRVEINSGILV